MLAFDPSQKMLGRLPAPDDAASAKSSSDAGGEDFLHRLLDVINPLQHLPVVGTIYRAATGEHIGTMEKIAGDALYGGLWGAVSSVADAAFEAVTGKDVEDTVLAWFSGGESQPAVAAVTVQPRMAVNVPVPTADLPSLPPDITVRAVDAYRRTVAPDAGGSPVVASLH